MKRSRRKLNGPNRNPGQLDLLEPHHVSKELSSPSDRRMSGPPPVERFVIYTDGACIENPGGAGSWAFIAIRNGKEIYQGSGFCASTTNNRMELQAIIEALKSVAEYQGVTVFTDSQYAQRGAMKWVKKWALQGWKLSRKDAEVKNVDLWLQIAELMKTRFVDIEWVRRHNGDYWNEYCDQLAQNVVFKS